MHELLTGKHIILRKAKESDYRSMLKNVLGDPYVYEWMLFEPTFTEEEAIGIMSVMSDRRALYHSATDSTERFLIIDIHTIFKTILSIIQQRYIDYLLFFMNET